MIKLTFKENYYSPEDDTTLMCKKGDKYELIRTEYLEMHDKEYRVIRWEDIELYVPNKYFA